MASTVALFSRLNAHVTMNPRDDVPFSSKLLSAAYANRGAPPSAVLARFESTCSASSGACRRICASAARFTSGSITRDPARHFLAPTQKHTRHVDSRQSTTPHATSGARDRPHTTSSARRASRTASFDHVCARGASHGRDDRRQASRIDVALDKHDGVESRVRERRRRRNDAR